jgi:hypothetical protein
MQTRFATFVVLTASALAPTGAAAMNAGRSFDGRCNVVGEAKLPASSSGGVAICARVERAIAELAPTARYNAEIRVVSSSRLAATLVVNGRTLPEQKFAIMDRELNAEALERFARSLAAEVAKASKA